MDFDWPTMEFLKQELLCTLKNFFFPILKHAPLYLMTHYQFISLQFFMLKRLFWEFNKKLLRTSVYWIPFEFISLGHKIEQNWDHEFTVRIWVCSRFHIAVIINYYSIAKQGDSTLIVAVCLSNLSRSRGLTAKSKKGHYLSPVKHLSVCL